MPTTVARYSQLFIPTLKEAPADAQVASHKLLVRAGFIRQLGAGIYDYLPLAKRTLTKIEAIVREEMDAIGGQEFFLPALHPAEIWKESGRWEVMGDNMFRLRDRQERRVLPRHDARGDLHRHRARRAAQLPPAAAGLVPDPDQVPRRAAAEVGPAARAPVHA